MNFGRPEGDRITMGSRVTGAEGEASLEALLGVGGEGEPAGTE